MGWTSDFPEITETCWADAVDIRYKHLHKLSLHGRHKEDLGP